MDTTNENILKSLAVLEQNLKDIESAKKQVNKVVQSSDDLIKVATTYNSSFEGVTKNLKATISEIKNVNLDTIKDLSNKNKELSSEVTRLTEFDFTNSFDSIETKVIENFEKDLKKSFITLDKKIKYLQDETSELQGQTTRLKTIDIDAHFNKISSDLTKDYNEVKAQNQKLLKETKTNRIGIIVGVIIIIILSIINIILN